MKTPLAVVAIFLLSVSVGLAEPIGVGTTEAKLLAQKGPPESKAVAGNKVIYRWKDMQATVIDGKVDQVQARNPTTEKRKTGITTTVPVKRSPANAAPVTGPTQAGKAPSPTQKMDDAATTNRKRDTRRETLATEIAMYQGVMDRFDKQNAFKKSPFEPWITREQYETAKAGRDKRQQERDELSR